MLEAPLKARASGSAPQSGGMNFPLPVPTMRRLAIVKYLHTQALEQERKGGPLAGLALLPFHDAVELFLQVAAETHHLTMTSQQRLNSSRTGTRFQRLACHCHTSRRCGASTTRVWTVKHKGLLPIHDRSKSFGPLSRPS